MPVVVAAGTGHCSAAGLLDARVGGAPVYPYQTGMRAWEALAITKERDFTYPASTGVLTSIGASSFTRSGARTVNPANMFDSSNRQTCPRGDSRRPSHARLHALTTLNDSDVGRSRSSARRAQLEVVSGNSTRG